MKNFTKLCLLLLFSVSTSFAQFARVQVIHNSPDPAAAEVDVYLNGNLLLNDFAFRTATPFVPVPAGIPLNIDIAPANSTSVAESIYNLPTTLADGETYILVADGIVSQIGTTAPNFTISVFAPGRETANDPMMTDVLVNHGSPDAPTVDVVETSVTSGATVVDNISFPNFSPGYLELSTLDYTLDIRDETGTVTVASYSAPLQTLGLGGAAITVLASGFLDPSVGTDLPAFGLWVATAAGGDLIPLPMATSPAMARAQVIHNSPDPAAEEVDVYLNGNLLLNDFAFRTATPFVDVPADTEISIDIAPANSTSVAESIYNLTTTLADGETYILVADGIISQLGPTAPNFTISVFAPGREMSNDPMMTDVLVNHGSPDAPTVDVVETSVTSGATVVDNISFPNFSPGYLELSTLDYTLDIRDETGTVTVASYSAPLQTLGLGGAAITVLASGFLDPSVGTDLPAFGLWVATATGGDLIPLPMATAPAMARAQIIHNSPDPAAAEVDVYLNGDLLLNDFAFRTATPFVDVPADTEISIDIAPANSTSVAESIYNLTTTLADGETYILVADGIISQIGPTAPNFTISVFAPGREMSNDPMMTDVLVNHGSPDAPTVDVVETSVTSGATVVDNISFPNFSPGYLELETLDYTLDIRDETGTVTVASYSAPLQTLGLGGAAITVLASGFLDPSVGTDLPAFGLWVATAAGGDLIPLPAASLSRSNFESNAFAVYPNPATEMISIRNTNNVSINKATIVDLNGRVVKEINSGFENINVSNLNRGMYLMSIATENSIINKKIIINN